MTKVLHLFMALLLIIATSSQSFAKDKKKGGKKKAEKVHSTAPSSSSNPVDQDPNSIANLEAIRAIHPSDSDNLLRLARAKRKAGVGTNAEAIALVEESLWFNKFNELKADDAKLELAKLKSATGQGEAANKLLAQVSKESSASFDAQVTMGDNFLAQSKNREAEARYRAALKLSPDAADVKKKLAGVLLSPTDRSVKKGEIDEAERLLEAAFRGASPAEQIKDPAYADLLKAKVLGGKLEEAGEKLTAALAQYPNNQAFLKVQKQLALEKQVAAMATPAP